MNLNRESSRFRIEQGIIAQIRRSPLGVVLCMGPFNYPLNETFGTVMSAVLVANTVLFKPPKHGTLLHAVDSIGRALCQCAGARRLVS